MLNLWLWRPIWGSFRGAFWDSVAGSRISEKTLKTIENLFFEFPGVEVDAKTGPETASGRDWAARGSWEAPGSDLGAIVRTQLQSMSTPIASSDF